MEKHNHDQVRAALANVKRIQRSLEYMGENVEIDWRSTRGLDRSLADFSRLMYDAEEAVKALELLNKEEKAIENETVGSIVQRLEQAMELLSKLEKQTE